MDEETNTLGVEPEVEVKEVGVVSAITHSPTIRKTGGEQDNQIDFYAALKAIVEGKKVTKLEWADEGFYGVLDGTYLKLHKPDNQLYSWILNDGDISGTDYVVIN